MRPVPTAVVRAEWPVLTECDGEEIEVTVNTWLIGETIAEAIKSFTLAPKNHTVFTTLVKPRDRVVEAEVKLGLAKLRMNQSRAYSPL